MTPAWVPLGVAIIGLISTLFGVVLTQRRSDHRENQTWIRERDRERERWSREDADRTFELRRSSYAEFFSTVGKLREEVMDELENSRADSFPRARSAKIEEAFVAFRDVQMYGSQAVMSAAYKVHTVLTATNFGKQEVGKLLAAEAHLLLVFRLDLGIPMGASTAGVADLISQINT